MLLHLTRIRPRAPRRGVTLVEMLVAVALLVLMMTVIVQVFAAATGAVSVARGYQELDSVLRQADSTIRQDLENVTARLTPPLNPKDNLGYFEYGENSYADLQGEDADDYVRFTVKAPEGQIFTGRFWPNSLPPGIPIPAPGTVAWQNYVNSQPITITSQYAEVIYFLRNGNLYRRVLLVAPDRQPSTLSAAPIVVPGALGGGNLGQVTLTGWQGVNDLSAHPSETFNTAINLLANNVVLNSLGDLTNRENRFAYSRFCNDFATYNPANANFTNGGDGVPDDTNGDFVPDFWPSLNWTSATTGNLMNPTLFFDRSTMAGVTFDTVAFPYTFPGAYSVPHGYSLNNALGWIHAPDPGNNQVSLAQLNNLNHNPIAVGDSLPLPTTPETWWGFPTWRETLGFFWNDPIQYIGNGNGQPNGLHPFVANALPSFAATSLNVLPPMNTVTFGGSPFTPATPFRVTAQPNTDNSGSPHFAIVPSPPFPTADYLWRQSWEDDLLMTGVRSFDVKAYDNAYAGYVDLGWGNDLRQYMGYIPTNTLTGLAPQYLGDLNTLPGVILWPPPNNGTWPPTSNLPGASVYDLIGQTYAHEGRIPPKVIDGRVDPQNPIQTWNNTLNPNNIGDNTPGIVRLRRVWDSWSTDYSNAPATGINPANGAPVGPPYGAPLYPSYPPPYPMPLRGIQIQIRVVDPASQLLKTLTIRHDFSDRL
jgi:prepilin-type N-terminal cleavage/methylation domain-containing protein